MKAGIAVALALAVAASAEAAKKYIFASWELGDTTPWEVLAHADEFDKADGWRDGAALVRILDGENNLYVLLDAGTDEKSRKVEFRDFEIFRIL